MSDHGPSYYAHTTAWPASTGGPVMSADELASALESMDTYYQAAMRMSDDGYVEARDKEWAAAGDELGPGTDLVVVWGVKFTCSTGSHISEYGDGDRDEAGARKTVDDFTPNGSVTRKVMRRRVLYGPWEEA